MQNDNQDYLLEQDASPALTAGKVDAFIFYAGDGEQVVMLAGPRSQNALTLELSEGVYQLRSDIFNYAQSIIADGELIETFAQSARAKVEHGRAMMKVWSWARNSIDEYFEEMREVEFNFADAITQRDGADGDRASLRDIQHAASSIAEDVSKVHGAQIALDTARSAPRFSGGRLQIID